MTSSSDVAGAKRNCHTDSRQFPVHNARRAQRWVRAEPAALIARAPNAAYPAPTSRSPWRDAPQSMSLEVR